MTRMTGAINCIAGTGVALMCALSLAACGGGLKAQTNDATEASSSSSDKKAPQVSFGNDDSTEKTSSSGELTITEDDTTIVSGDVAGMWENVIVVENGNARHAEEVLKAVPTMSLGADGTGELRADTKTMPLTWTAKEKGAYIDCSTISGNVGITKSGMLLWHGDGEADDTYTLWLPTTSMTASTSFDDFDFSGTYDDADAPSASSGGEEDQPSDSPVPNNAEANAASGSQASGLTDAKPSPTSDPVVGYWVVSGKSSSGITEAIFYEDSRAVFLMDGQRHEGTWEHNIGALTIKDGTGTKVGEGQVDGSKLYLVRHSGGSAVSSVDTAVRQ